MHFWIGCLAVCLMLSQQSMAQDTNHGNPRGERKPFDREAFMAERNAYITKKMGLTTEEVAAFIPLENELLQKKFEAGRKCHKIEKELRKKEHEQNKKENKNDEEYNKLLKCREEVKEKRDSLDREYQEKFKEVLSAEQILKYQAADRDFFEERMRKR